MSQRSIEILIGRLLTDESFRESFRADRRSTLEVFNEEGHALTSIEVSAVLSTPAQVWAEFAGQVDHRLRRSVGSVVE